MVTRELQGIDRINYFWTTYFNSKQYSQNFIRQIKHLCETKFYMFIFSALWSFHLSLRSIILSKLNFFSTPLFIKDQGTQHHSGNQSACLIVL
jgi:hypothetical protein